MIHEISSRPDVVLTSFSVELQLYLSNLCRRNVFHTHHVHSFSQFALSLLSLCFSAESNCAEAPRLTGKTEVTDSCVHAREDGMLCQQNKLFLAIFTLSVPLGFVDFAAHTYSDEVQC